jgi:hypothetical protein
MQVIKLKRDLLENVRSGTKTASTRKGLKPLTIGPAMLVDPADPLNFVSICVTSVHLYDWRSIRLSSHLYISEGYDASWELDEALEDIYGEFEDNQLMTVFCFRQVKEQRN